MTEAELSKLVEGMMTWFEGNYKDPVSMAVLEVYRKDLKRVTSSGLLAWLVAHGYATRPKED